MCAFDKTFRGSDVQPFRGSAVETFAKRGARKLRGTPSAAASIRTEVAGGRYLNALHAGDILSSGAHATSARSSSDVFVNVTQNACKFDEYRMVTSHFFRCAVCTARTALPQWLRRASGEPARRGRSTSIAAMRPCRPLLPRQSRSFLGSISAPNAAAQPCDRYQPIVAQDDGAYKTRAKECGHSIAAAMARGCVGAARISRLCPAPRARSVSLPPPQQRLLFFSAASTVRSKRSSDAPPLVKSQRETPMAGVTRDVLRSASHHGASRARVSRALLPSTRSLFSRSTSRARSQLCAETRRITAL